MPTNKNAMTRYALIDELLSNRHKAVSIRDITKYINCYLKEQNPDDKGVSKRCIEKDIEYLEYESPFMVELERYTVDALNAADRPYKKRCIRYSDPTYSLFKKKLTADEKSILASTLNTLGSFEGLDNFEWLEELRNRLRIEQRKPIVSISKNIVENSNLIASLFTAIANEQVIELNYRKFVDSEPRKVVVSPYLLKEYNRRWYLFCSATDSDKILNFALDRIEAIEVKPGMTYKPCTQDIFERFEEIVGVSFYDHLPLMPIIFWVDKSIEGYIRTRPIHESQTHISGERKRHIEAQFPMLPEGEFFFLCCRENHELLRELNVWGAQLIVLFPNSIKYDLWDWAEEMAERYKQIGDTELDFPPADKLIAPPTITSPLPEALQIKIVMPRRK